MPTPNLNRDTFNFVDPEAPEAWELDPVFIKSYSTGSGGTDDNQEPPLEGVRIFVDNNENPPETDSFDFIA
ncbi:MAG: hypothetical protein HKN05_00735 [Rhizobiales bacterium]|nr:hypothetical protein [Hyphomicrobiales bacterium]